MRSGYDVLGVDYSAGMIKLAKQQAPKARFRCGSFVDVEIPPCRAVTAMGEVLCYLIDEQAEEKTLIRLFERVHEALVKGVQQIEPPAKPANKSKRARRGGLFIFDIAVPGRSKAIGRRQAYWEGDDWLVAVQTDEDSQTHILTRRIATFRKRGRQYRRSDEVHRLQLYQPTQLVDKLRDIGFKVRIARRYGDYQLPRGIVGIVAKAEGT